MNSEFKAAVSAAEELPDYWQEWVARKIWKAVREERIDMALTMLDADERQTCKLDLTSR